MLIKNLINESLYRSSLFFDFNLLIKRSMEYDVKSLVIGLDLGGTNSVFGIVDGDGEIIATTSLNTQTFQRVEQ